jgi:hypothetical protein
MTMTAHVLIGAMAFAVLSSAATSTIALGADSDITFFGKDPGKGKAFACYTRHYEAKHLAAHRKQNVVDMTLFVNSFVDGDLGRQYTLAIGVHFRKSPTLFQLAGGCSPAADGEGVLNCGIDCDGGRIDVSVKDPASILVSIPDGARTWNPDSDAEPPKDANFGYDDKVFRLDKTELPTCLPLVFDDDVKAAISARK